METILVGNQISRENRPQQFEMFPNSKEPFVRTTKMGEQNLGL
jgi:hypothetical protein